MLYFPEHMNAGIRHRFAVIIAALLPFMVGVACTGVEPSSATASIRLGAFISLSGEAAPYGEMQKRGIDLAAREVMESGFMGNRGFQVFVADAGSGPESAEQAVKQLIRENRVSGLIGPTLSSQAFVSDPVAQASGIPVMAISNTAPGITEIGDYIFRCSLPESTVIARTVETAVTKSNIKRVGVLWQRDDAYTIGAYQAFVQSLYRNGVVMTGDESYSKGETDFKGLLGKLLAAKPDALAVAAFINDASRILVQARNLGFQGLIIGGNGFNSPVIIQEAGSAAEGVIVGTAWNSENQAPRNQSFIRLFEATYKMRPDQFAAQAYTGVWLYAEAAHNSPQGGPDFLRHALSGIRGFSTPLGSFRFDDEREPEHPSAVQMVRGGRFVIIAS